MEFSVKIENLRQIDELISKDRNGRVFKDTSSCISYRISKIDKDVFDVVNIENNHREEQSDTDLFSNTIGLAIKNNTLTTEVNFKKENIEVSSVLAEFLKREGSIGIVPLSEYYVSPNYEDGENAKKLNHILLENGHHVFEMELHCNDEWPPDDKPNYVLIELSSSKIERIVKLSQAVTQYDIFSMTELYSGIADYDPYLADDADFRTEGDELKIFKDGFHTTMDIKHTSIALYHSDIPIREILMSFDSDNYLAYTKDDPEIIFMESTDMDNDSDEDLDEDHGAKW